MTRVLQRRVRRTSWLIALVLALLPAVVMAIVPISYPTPVLVPIDINLNPGDQFDPHVSGDWVSYTSDLRIRYYNFATGTDAEIPPGSGVDDLLAGVSGSKIVFSRVSLANGTAIMAFDAATPTVAPVEIDPTPNANRFGAAIGGNTVAYIDFDLQANGELVIHDLVSSSSVRLTNDTAGDGNPAVSPDGNVVVWEHCATTITNCDIWQSVRTGGAWSAGVVANAAGPEGNPSTNGALVAYDAQRGGKSGIFWRPVSGGAEMELEMAGHQGNPSIAGNVIAFESRATAIDVADIFAYDISSNRLFQITNTPLVNEQLNDITVLPDGSVRIVWASDEAGPDQRHIKSATFQLPPAVSTLALHAPASVTVNATGPSGAIATFVVTATDAMDPNPTVVCAPPSGSLFRIGTMPVHCTAANAFGDHVSGRFDVTVKGAPEQIVDLITLVQSLHLRPAVALTLEAELWVAHGLATSSRPGDPLHACQWLNLFIHEVQTLAGGRTLSAAQTAQFVAEANRIMAVLGCR